jgi:hypothetical protein
MNPEPRISESAAGDGLMVFISVAVIAVIIAEAMFVAHASWLMLPVLMLGVIVAAGAVIFALVRVMDQDTPIATPAAPKPRATDEPAVVAARAPLRGTALAGR